MRLGSGCSLMAHDGGSQNRLKQVLVTRYTPNYRLGITSYPTRTPRQVDGSQIDRSKDILTSQVLVLEVNESNLSDEYVSTFLSDMLRHLRANPDD